MIIQKIFTQSCDTIGLLTIEICEVNMGLFNKDVKNENKALDTRTTAVESRIHKRLYLVDYENVSDAGLICIDKLSGFAIVVICVCIKSGSVACDFLRVITRSG